ncbi:MAG: Smr/MutS family protein [Cytophagaceae bacterium]|nr:Smr/MutS family protein [Cytophagaceae bacterium]
MSEIKPGSFVKIKGQETVAEVVSVKGNDVEIIVGIMKIQTKKHKLELAKASEIETPSQKKSENLIQSSGIDTKSKLMNFKFELDVRGKMKEEVITELTSWVDDALLLGIPEAKIVHGRGNGILKDTVRSFLKKYKEVDKVEDGPEFAGGNFVTVVKFKV